MSGAYLVDAAVLTEGAALSDRSPELWRLVRRFNRPVQLALAAAHDVAAHARDASQAALVSLAPCRGGSPELEAWLSRALPRAGNTFGSVPKMNPVHTLHVIDNLALSSFAIHFGNRSHCVGLGGSAGQMWSSLEAVVEILSDTKTSEVIVMAGDQRRDRGTGLAMLYAAAPRRHRSLGRSVRVLEVDRRPSGSDAAVSPHAVEGAARWLEALATTGPGRFDYAVPPADGDGLDDVTVRTELGA